jgi:hypothetical protein
VFPVTHIYFYSLLFPRHNAGAIGAIFPDTTLLTGLRWPVTHKFALEIFNSLSPEVRAANLSFLRGFLSHSVDSHGLDYYGDEKFGSYEKGYAYIKSTPIIPDVVRACRIPDTMGLWKAHNFIEMGIETLVARSNPDLTDWIEEVRQDNKEINCAAKFLSHQYNIPTEILEKSISEFFRFIISSGDPLELAKSYKCVLGIRHGITNPDPEEIAQVIVKASELIKDEYMDFLMFCRNSFYEEWKDILF